MKIDAFAHILPVNFYHQMLDLAPEIPDKFPFIKIPTLIDLKKRLATWPEQGMKQVISLANINPEDFVNPVTSAKLCNLANEELSTIVRQHPDYFQAGVGTLPMNNVPAATEILQKIAQSKTLAGAQIFTRHLGKSIADPKFAPVLKSAANLNVPLWLHPVFDERKPDNELVFSWEYELSQAMYQLVMSDVFEKYPGLKILVHHAGAMVPFFSGRINHILNSRQAADFKKFYVDTAILGNTPALQLAIDYCGIDHVLYGTDAPFAVMPAGANQEISNAVDQLAIDQSQKQQIYHDNYVKFVHQ